MDEQNNLNGEFTLGSSVVYGMHGRCSVVSIETRSVGNESIPFYKLEIQKSALSRSNRREPAIWLPVNSARSRGLRPPMSVEQAEEVFAILENREYYFSTSESWSSIEPKLESSIRLEGHIGLGKVMSYLHVLKEKQIVTSPEVNRFRENFTRVLLRELSETLGEPIRAIETRVAKALKHKTLPDN